MLCILQYLAVNTESCWPKRYKLTSLGQTSVAEPNHFDAARDLVPDTVRQMMQLRFRLYALSLYSDILKKIDFDAAKAPAPAREIMRLLAALDPG
jgi:hypothetical protein